MEQPFVVRGGIDLMALVSKTVRLFVSSTFRDMHAERDHLVRTVFPELRERCRALHVQLIDVDLRWGVSEEDALHGRALDICLDEIDSCRPYFLGLLGHRYGYVPDGEAMSITAAEIHHAVLHGHVPRQLTDLRRILEEELNGEPLSDEQKACLQRCYLWEADRRKHLLAEDISQEDGSLLRSAFERIAAYQRDRSLFFFRTESLTRRLAGEELADFFVPEDREKLEALKDEIVAAGLWHAAYDDIEALGHLVTEALWERIEEEAEAAEKRDWLAEEAELHELFAAERTRHFAGRRDLLERLDAFCGADAAPGVAVVAGEPGSGKSALLAQLGEEAGQRHPEWLVLRHFVGASAASTGLRETLRRIGTHLRRSLGLAGDAPEDIRDLLEIFPTLLERTASRRRVVLLLDAANQFNPWDNAHSMQWLPQPLPPHVRVVVSTLPGTSLDALLARKPQPELLTVGALTASEIRDLVGRYLAEIRHAFPGKQVEEAFFEKVSHGNPLYVLVALEELRVFGEFEALPQRVAELPDTVPALFGQVLERIEGDYAPRPGLVRDLMAFLTCVRQPLPGSVFQALLRAHAPRLEPGVEPARLPDMLWARLYRAFRPYLFERAGLIDFFHGQLKEAAEARYLGSGDDRVAAHEAIAAFCRGWRGLADPQAAAYARRYLVFHLAQARQWDALTALLQDVEFLKATRRAGCSPVASLAEAAGENPERIRGLLRTLLASDVDASCKLATDTCGELEWLDLLVEAAEGEPDQTRMWACLGLFAVYGHRRARGDGEGAWEGMRLLRRRLRGRLGYPRRRAVAATMGLMALIFTDAADDRSQLQALIEQVRDAAWAILPFRRARRPWGRRLQKHLVHLLLHVIRPGVSLAITGLRNLASSVNLATARAYFRQSRQRRESLRVYFPYIEPVPRDLGPLADAMRTHCTARDAFHGNLILACAVTQGAAQPDATIAVLRDMAAIDDPQALYLATRGLAYALTTQREAGRTPRPEHDDLLRECLVRFYRLPEREIDLHGSELLGRSLAEYVGEYLAQFGLPQATAFDELIRHARETGDESLQCDLFDALGIIGHHGHHEFALERSAPALQSSRPMSPRVRATILSALACIHFHRPHDVATWVESLLGSSIGIEDIAQAPVRPTGTLRVGSDRNLRHILLHEPEMRCVVHRMLDGLPRARSLSAYLLYAARVLLDLLIDEQVPPNPYAAPIARNA